METLKINGVEKRFSSKIPQTLGELLEQLNVKAEAAVAEVDGRIIESADFASTRLKQGQCIELIRFVPGG